MLLATEIIKADDIYIRIFSENTMDWKWFMVYMEMVHRRLAF